MVNDYIFENVKVKQNAFVSPYVYKVSYDVVIFCGL